MNVDSLLTDLQSEGIVFEDDRGTLELNDKYGALVESFEETNNQDTNTELGEAVPNQAKPIADLLADRSPSLLAYFLALQKMSSELQLDEQIQTLHVLPQIKKGSPPVDGSPQAFYSLYIEQLLGLIPLHDRAIVYIWRRDCQPCDIIKAELNTIFETPPDDIAVFSHYGPNASRELATEFNVQGGPALLFFTDGEIDARLYGAQYGSVIRNEIQELQSFHSSG